MQATTLSVDPNSAILLGPTYSYTNREGFYDFPELNKSQPLSRNGLHLFGGILGKRWRLTEHFRFQASFAFDAGTVIDDTLKFDSPALAGSSFRQASVEPALHVPLLTAGRVRPFILLGAGLNFLHTAIRTFNLDKSKEIEYTDRRWLYVRSNRFSIHAAAGLGTDAALSRSLTISLWYSLRYVQPLGYGIVDDFPLSAQEYHESWLGNCLHLSILFAIR
jgi:hypothetical protein